MKLTLQTELGCLRELAPEHRQLHDLSGSSLVPKDRPLSMPHEPGGYRMDHGGTQRNGRLNARLPAYEWEERWVATVGDRCPPLGLLHTQDRVLVRAATSRLLDMASGEERGRFQASAGGACLDPIHDALYHVDRHGMLRALSLRDASLTFSAATRGGPGVCYDLVQRVGDRLLLGGREAPSRGHLRATPAASTLESWTLPDGPATDDAGRWRAPPAPALILPSGHAHAAVAEGALLLAFPGHFACGAPDLTLDAVYAGGPFRPIALCCDRKRRAYLLLEREEQVELWVLLQSGARVLRLPVARELVVEGRPPLVSHRHVLFFTAPHRIRAVGPAGDVLWEAEPRGGLAGAVVTGDDLLLASEADRVVVYGPGGERRELHHFDGDRLVTPPLLTLGGDLLVASRRQLYCLKPQA